MAEFHVARLETALPLVDEYRLAAAGIENGALRNRQHRLRAAGGDFGVGIHVGAQQAIRICKLNADARGTSLSVEMRIDQSDLSAEDTVYKGARAHIELLPDGNSFQIALGDIDQNPHHLMIGNAEQQV